ncbi:glucan endo-1,3-beta-D-glucosidase-like [Nymphaea colorata]|nr:glucan endo-1,3-beta-D-glucosidase-like [Nymphaea colorata]
MASRVTMTLLAILLLIFFSTYGPFVKAVNGQNNTWCIARPSTEETVLQNNIDFACSNGVDCSVLAPGQRCSLPNTRLNHASVVMNLYYSANGRQPYTCSFGNSGLITIVDPSYGSCVFP